MSAACVLHVDVDAFFAAVEQRDAPELLGRPVAVGTGVVASCSYESRRWGVRTGMRLTEARGRCPSLIVLPGDYRRYELASRRILGICLEHTARVEMAALDDLYLDLTQHGFGNASRFAREIAKQVREEVGVRVSLGLGTSKLVAAIATQQVKDGRNRAARSLKSKTEADLAPCFPAKRRVTWRSGRRRCCREWGRNRASNWPR